MRLANIVTAIAVLPWLCLFVMGRDLTYDIYTHGLGIYPNSAQFDFYVLLPISVASTLMLCAWVFNIFQRFAPLLAAVSAISFFAIFPYLLLYSGGI